MTTTLKEEINDTLKEHKNRTLLNDIKYQRNAYTADVYKAIQISDRDRANATILSAIKAKLPEKRIVNEQKFTYSPEYLSELAGYNKALTDVITALGLEDE